MVGGGAHLLVVVGLGHGTAPVHDEGTAAVVRHAHGADVDVARRPAGPHLEPHLGKVGLAEKDEQATELLHVHVVRLVVDVDHGVEGLDRSEGLHRLVVSREVGADLLAHLHEVAGGAALALGELRRYGVAQRQQLCVDLREVGLLLLEDLVHPCLPGRGAIPWGRRDWGTSIPQPALVVKAPRRHGLHSMSDICMA